jgi:PhnB protein
MVLSQSALKIDGIVPAEVLQAAVCLHDQINSNMTQINAYLTFDGNCRQAMTFYKNCFGGELTLQTVEGSPMADKWPASVQQNILHASLIKNNLVLLASDMVGADGIIKGNTISLAITCSSDREIETFFLNLSSGGEVTHPLHKFFDGTIGALTDKFGVNWILKF